MNDSDSLPPGAFRRIDESPDEIFYQTPRFVTHIDDAAIEAVTQLYREYFPPKGIILDLMSSWISHLPEEVKYQEVVGLGMNKEELKANPRLNEYVVQNLNTHPKLPFVSDRFDAAGICVSIDYLTQPIEVLQDLSRVLKPDAPLVITISNRCFPQKAVAIWHALDDQGRIHWVKQLLELSNRWRDIKLTDRTYPRGHDPLYGVIGRNAKLDI